MMLGYCLVCTSTETPYLQHQRKYEQEMSCWPQRKELAGPAASCLALTITITSCLQLLDDGREGEIMPEGYLPFDYNLWRIMGHDID